MVQGKINRGRHTDHLAGRHSIRTNQCPPPPSGWYKWPESYNYITTDYWVLQMKCNYIRLSTKQKIKYNLHTHSVRLPQTLSKPREASVVLPCRRSPWVHCLPACRHCESAADCSHHSPTAQTVHSSAKPATINITLQTTADKAIGDSTLPPVCQQAEYTHECH